MRPESDVDAAMLSETVMSAIWSVLPELTVTRRVERAGAGRRRGGDRLVDRSWNRRSAGPVIEPTGPMIETTWPGLKTEWRLATGCTLTIGRSKVTWNWLVESLVSRFPLPVETSPDVPTACVVRICGPGTIRGRVFWLNGGLRTPLAPVVNVTGAVELGRRHGVDVARRQAGVAAGNGRVSGFSSVVPLAFWSIGAPTGAPASAPTSRS